LLLLLLLLLLPLMLAPLPLPLPLVAAKVVVFGSLGEFVLCLSIKLALSESQICNNVVQHLTFWLYETLIQNKNK
jgi:hypothetical protein